ncbi:MAG: prepilin-type N-terminal cleavage/methylation domain-containing protein, partial [Clostridia bacterium]|nr:prepilin-type N-terminal cleavage/methylation domain-containing protein [Clostridia bacterium]
MFKLFYKNKKGFSLHELIITVAIVGLVVGIAGTALFL